MTPSPKEYRMIYKGPDFLAVVRFGSKPTPSYPVPHRTIDLERETTRWRERKGEGVGEEPNHTEWPQEILILYNNLFNTLCLDQSNSSQGFLSFVSFWDDECNALLAAWPSDNTVAVFFPEQ